MQPESRRKTTLGQITNNSWLLSEGGPFVLMGEIKSLRWKGDSALSTHCPFPPVGNDYTRAARFLTHEGVISDEDGEVFVFFSEGLCSKIIGGPREFILFSWEFTGDNESKFIVENELSKFRFVSDLLYFFVSENRLSLFDSKCSGQYFKGNSIDVEVGRYKVSLFEQIEEDFAKFGKYTMYKFVLQ